MKRLSKLANTHAPRTGSRIRARRLDLGLRQADLAQMAGISPSYLNLIEHDKRRIAGRLLADISLALQTEPGLLTDGAERTVLEAMQRAASEWEPGLAEVAKADELAARYPGWAGLIAAQAARINALETRAQMLTDRITYDPDLATALHGVISAVTAIRSTASILTSDEKIDAEWQQRFHRNIHDDAVRLAAESDALVTYFDAPDAGAGVPLSPLEEVEAVLDACGWHLDAIEAGQPATDLSRNLRKPAQEVFDTWAAVYARDAAALPIPEVEAAIAKHGYDLWGLASALGGDLAQVMRRLASLPATAGRPPMGLVLCDAGGFPTLLKQIPDFAFPRGTACPLWPVFTALGQAGRPIISEVAIPGHPQTRLTCWAIAQTVGDAQADRPPLLQATMLVMADSAPGQGPAVPVGVSCRICPRTGCAARREPSALGTAPADPL